MYTNYKYIPIINKIIILIVSKSCIDFMSNLCTKISFNDIYISTNLHFINRQ